MNWNFMAGTDREQNESRWWELTQEMRPNDMLYINHISDLGLDSQSLTERLLYCSHEGIRLYDDDRNMEVDVEFVIEMLDSFIEMRKEEMKTAQKQGIKKALKKKADGSGCYGRLSAILPKNFKERVMHIHGVNGKLNDYCEELHMAKSTFYKYVKIVMKEQQDL